MRYEIFIDSVGEYKWMLKTENNEIIAISEGYVSRLECYRSIKKAQKANKNTPIKETA